MDGAETMNGMDMSNEPQFPPSEYRQYYCHDGTLITMSRLTPATMYDGLNHQIADWGYGVVGQMLTRCGKRACPYRGLRKIPGRGPVDCPECKAA